MTTWADELTRIRRYLRDPDGNIWSDALILTTWNNEQRSFQRKSRILEGLTAVRVPPMVHMAYAHDWEWAHVTASENNYQYGFYYHQTGHVCSYRWEMELLAGVSATDTDNGYAYLQPWEAWTAGSHNKPVEINLPGDFGTARFVAWDNEPIDYWPLKSIQKDDASWQTRRGKPFGYYRPDEADNAFCLYPMPETPVFDDFENIDVGIVSHIEDDTVDSETGEIADRTGNFIESGAGVTTDVIETDDNVLFIYDAEPEDLTVSTDTIGYPDFILKYIRFGCLSRLYTDNTDGRIDSLRDYWRYRADIGGEAIKRYKRMRRQDRDYQFMTKGSPGFRTRREPRLPDAYPAIPRY